MGQLFDVAVMVGRVDAWVTLCLCCCLASFAVSYGAGLVDREGHLQKRGGTPPPKGRLPAGLLLASLFVCCGVLYVVAVSRSKTVAAGAGIASIADAVTSPFFH